MDRSRGRPSIAGRRAWRRHGAQWRCLSLLGLAILAAIAACGEDRRFEGQGRDFRLALLDTLMAHGVCPSPVECRQRSVILWQPRSDWLDLGIYGVRSERTATAIRAACQHYVATTPGAPPLYLRVYNVTKQQAVESFGRPKPTWLFKCRRPSDAPRRS